MVFDLYKLTEVVLSFLDVSSDNIFFKVIIYWHFFIPWYVIFKSIVKIQRMIFPRDHLYVTKSLCLRPYAECG